MSKTYRNILFFVFVTFFLIAAPAIVLYTAGIKYNPASGGISLTGVISVTTSPRSADLLLNGEDIGRNSPYVIKNLDPGMYDLGIQKTGYHPWSGKLNVRGSETTFVQNVMLFRQAIPELIIDGLPDSISTSPDNKMIAYLEVSKSSPGSNLVIWDVENNRSALVEAHPEIQSPKEYTLDWSSGGNHLLVSSNIKRENFIASLSETAIPTEALLTDEVDRVFWHPSTENLLYLSTSAELRQINLASGSIDIFEGENLNSAIIDASIITFFDNGGQVELRQTVGGETRLIALLPKSEYSILDRYGSYFMVGDRRGELFLIDIRADRPLLLESKARMFDWLEAEELLVYSDGNEINVYDPKTHSIEFITRQGAEITSVKWHGLGSSILATTKDSITAIETFKTAEERMVTPLLNEAQIETFWISSDSKTAYYFANNKLYQLELTK